MSTKQLDLSIAATGWRRAILELSDFMLSESRDTPARGGESTQVSSTPGPASLGAAARKLPATTFLAGPLVCVAALLAIRQYPITRQRLAALVAPPAG
jgi:hypothetical protein